MENNNIKSINSILVTGSPRSGTTWVGRMIALSSDVGYIHEPFNPIRLYGSCGYKFAKINHKYIYITQKNEDYIRENFNKTLSFHYNIIESIKHDKTLKDHLLGIRWFIRFLYNSYNHLRPLVKDPFAIFSLPWLVNSFSMDVVITIRHPAAFVGSLKIRKRNINFSNFLEQPLLMRDHLYPFEQDIRNIEANDKDIVDQGILLWRIINYMVMEYQKKYNNWIFIRHEDLSLDPIREYNKIFQKLNLEFTDTIKDIVIGYTQKKENSVNQIGSDGKIGNFMKRDSISNILSWKKRLSEDEIKRIRIGVEDISSNFYEDIDWN